MKTSEKLEALANKLAAIASLKCEADKLETELTLNMEIVNEAARVGIKTFGQVLYFRNGEFTLGTPPALASDFDEDEPK